MNIRKFFNFPNEDQKALLEANYERLENLADGKARDLNADEYHYQASHDGKCPNCGETNIVNKITRVQGEGSVSGSFSLGFGSVYGSSSTDTNEVNHCNSCGNQWKKYKTNYKWKSEIIGKWLNKLHYCFEGKDDSGDKTMEMLQNKNIYAETLAKALNEVSYYCYSWTKENLSLAWFRKHFKSIYDTEK
jgi:hypothetical protein